MLVANTITNQLEGASWIRRMFEEGARLKAERGAENVFDFTLGNPEVDPPEEVIAALRRIAAENRKGSHGYMPNAGFAETREAMARRLTEATGVEFTRDLVLMTCGAAGAMNVVLKAMLDPGDEVIVLVPYFPEYRFYIENHGGKVVPVETDEAFLPDVARIAAAITPRTKAIVINSPNNPTGAVYPAGVLEELDTLLCGLERTVVAISDEPYKALVFDGARQAEVASIVRHTVIANSWSKAQAISGERIGYLAISPRIGEAQALSHACTFTNRTLGFVNASAIWQLVAAEAGDAVVDVRAYQEKRDLLCEGLARIGYQAPKPQGSFYVFPRSPLADDVAFIGLLAKEGVLAVPGSGFGRSGYFRLSLTTPRETIERSLAAFARAFQAAG
jgi:aspartate aminotransferase